MNITAVAKSMTLEVNPVVASEVRERYLCKAECTVNQQKYTLRTLIHSDLKELWNTTFKGEQRDVQKEHGALYGLVNNLYARLADQNVQQVTEEDFSSQLNEQAMRARKSFFSSVVVYQGDEVVSMVEFKQGFVPKKLSDTERTKGNDHLQEKSLEPLYDHYSVEDKQPVAANEVRVHALPKFAQDGDFHAAHSTAMHVMGVALAMRLAQDERVKPTNDMSTEPQNVGVWGYLFSYDTTPTYFNENNSALVDRVIVVNPLPAELSFSKAQLQELSDRKKNEKQEEVRQQSRLQQRSEGFENIGLELFGYLPSNKIDDRNLGDKTLAVWGVNVKK